jgi:sterol desaturase/sphingolipid hydroxylase (fatty acid hydroxylase superfamily)
MSSFVNFWEEIPSLYRFYILVGGLTFFWTLESILPSRKHSAERASHALTNLFFTLTTILVNFSLAGIIFFLSYWSIHHKIGILTWIEMPLIVQIIVGLLLLDLVGAYTPHFVQHKVKWLWQYHVIHHTDTQVDSTSANRHHPGESVIRAFFTMIAVVFCGAPMWLVMLYQAASVSFSQFNHSNLKLPNWLDSLLGWIIVTPNMHRVHHHFQQPITDTNYGNIFSFWDKIFGTYIAMEEKDIVFGIDTYTDPNENSKILSLIKIPFLGYREPSGGDKK